jgi:hypothetical protein
VLSFFHALFSLLFRFFALCFWLYCFFRALFSLCFCAHFCFALMSASRIKSAWRSPLVATEPDRNCISSGIYRKTATSCCDDVTSIHRPSAAKKLFSSRSLFLWTTKALPSPLYTILTLRFPRYT